MKYCLDFIKQNKDVLNDVDEIYCSEISTLETLCQHHSNKRIIIKILFKKELLEAIQICKETNNNYAISLLADDKELISLLKEAKIPFFLNKLANTWDIFTELIELGVSDIYITEELGFELDKIATIAHKKGIQIRAFPNICQSGSVSMPSLKSFFIRPEDVSIYESYIDVLEFFGNEEKQSILYKIYKDKKWFGKLKEIIPNFDSELDSRFIIPHFAKQRIKCGKKCLKGGKCKICERIEQLSKTLEKSNLLVKIENKEERGKNG